MKKLICAILAISAFSTVAFGEQAKKKQLTPEEKAAARERSLRKTGGMVTKPGVGKVAVINCQTKISEEKVKSKANEFQRDIFVDVEYINNTAQTTFDITNCRNIPNGAKAALYIINVPKLPMSLMCAEDGWAMINTAYLDQESRFDKQFARGVIMAFGGGVSQYEGSPMQTVRSVDDLDKVVSKTLALDSVIGIKRNLDSLGIKPPVRTSYKRACLEGWASTPTNEYQKAIWDQVHELPTNPVKIEFDPKKDK